MNQETADKSATMDTKVEEKTNGEAPHLPTIAIVFPDPKHPMTFQMELLNGVTEHQAQWATGWLYRRLVAKEERAWAREDNKSESLAAQVKKFGGRFKRR